MERKLKAEVVKMIVERLSEAKITFNESYERDALLDARITKTVKYDIVTGYRKILGDDFDIVITLRELRDYDHDLWHLIYASVWDSIVKKCGDEVDEELLQKDGGMNPLLNTKNEWLSCLIVLILAAGIGAIMELAYEISY